VVAIGIGVAGLLGWWILGGRGSAMPDGQRDTSAPLLPAVAEPAELHPVPLPLPVDVVRENATPAAEQAKPPAALPTEVALTVEQRRQVDRINKLVPGVSAEILSLVKSNPARFAELVTIVEAARTSIGELQTEAYRVQDAIVAVRLREGRFETSAVGGPSPLPQMPGEVVHSMGVHDPVQGKDIRKVFRIVPGESAEFDLVRSRMDNETLGIAKVTRDFLAATR